MNQKAQQAREYADDLTKKTQSYYIEQYGLEIARESADFDVCHIEEAYQAGWQAAMQHLTTLPLDKIRNEIVKEIHPEECHSKEEQ